MIQVGFFLLSGTGTESVCCRQFSHILVAVAAGHKKFANSQVTIWVDNAGSVAIWHKGYSTRCRLSSTIVTTIHAVAAAIDRNRNRNRIYLFRPQLKIHING
jgi:hypothetical protein